MELDLEAESFCFLIKHQGMCLVDSNIRLTKPNFSVFDLLLALMADCSLEGFVLPGSTKPLIFLHVAIVLAFGFKLSDVALMFALMARHHAQLEALNFVLHLLHLLRYIRLHLFLLRATGTFWKRHLGRCGYMII